MTQKLTILFDLDGTLIDTAPDLMNAHNHVMKKFGYETRSTDAIRNLIYKGKNFYGNIFKGKYLDCGTLNGYINSGIEISRDNK